MKPRDVALAVVLAAGCTNDEPWTGTDLDAEAWQACTQMAEHQVERGYIPDVEVARSIYRAAEGTDVRGVSEAVESLTRSGDGPERAWRMAADALAIVCVDRGWIAS